MRSINFDVLFGSTAVSISIGSNIQSLGVQRYLSRAASTLGTVNERLSSGLRINRASDDAAGLAISMSLGTDTRIYSQAIRNLNDGLSAIAIADGAAGELAGILVRISELAEQSANGAYTNRQRIGLDREAQALRSEFNRIVEATSFNGVGLLGDTSSSIRLSDGTRSTRFGLNVGLSSLGVGSRGTVRITDTLQTGSQSDFVYADVTTDGLVDRVSINTSNVISVSRGNGDGTFATLSTFAVTGQGSLHSGDFDGDGDIDVGIQIGSDLSILTNNGDGSFRAPAIVSSGFGVRDVRDYDGDGTTDFLLQSGTSVRTLFGGSSGFRATQTSLSVSNTQYALDANGDGKIDVLQATGTHWHVSLGNGDGTFRASTSAANIAEVFGVGDVTGDGRDEVIGTADGVFTSVWSMSGANYAQLGGSFYSGFGTQTAYLVDFNNDGRRDLVTLDADSHLNVSLGNGNGTFEAAYDLLGGGPAGGWSNPKFADVNGDGVLDVGITDSYLGTEYDGYLHLMGKRSSSRLNTLSLATRSDALAALTSIGEARTSLSLSRSVFGAQERRISTAIENLASSRENYAAADSRIKDADIAQEAASAVQAQVRQQAASAILGQANTLPQLALALLRAA